MINIVGTLTEAWFEPLAAHQRVIGSSFTALATANEILLDVAVLHLELLANQTILEAQRLTERQSHDLAVIVTDFAVMESGAPPTPTCSGGLENAPGRGSARRGVCRRHCGSSGRPAQSRSDDPPSPRGGAARV